MPSSAIKAPSHAHLGRLDLGLVVQRGGVEGEYEVGHRRVGLPRVAAALALPEAIKRQSGGIGRSRRESEGVGRHEKQ